LVTTTEISFFVSLIPYFRVPLLKTESQSEFRL
jgi:hypothetical protein